MLFRSVGQALIQGASAQCRHLAGYEKEKAFSTCTLFSGEGLSEMAVKRSLEEECSTAQAISQDLQAVHLSSLTKTSFIFNHLPVFTIMPAGAVFQAAGLIIYNSYYRCIFQMVKEFMINGWNEVINGLNEG